MSDPYQEENWVQMDSLNIETIEVVGEIDRTVRPLSEVLRKLREDAQRRQEQQPPPENGSTQRP